MRAPGRPSQLTAPGGPAEYLPTATGLLPPGAFQAVFGESLGQALDLTTWQPGPRLGDLYGALDAEVEAAVRAELPVRTQIREAIFERLAGHHDLPREAGVYRATVDDIALAHRGLLFRGAVEACNGIAVSHESLAVTITQIGVCLVSYRAERGAWVHRLFRRELRSDLDPLEAAIALIEQRETEAVSDGARRLSDLARRGVMAYAERAAILDGSRALWRMGHGNPVPYELLTGSGSMELLDAGLELMARLIDEHKRFVFVPSGWTERGLLTLGDALRPLEYAIVDRMTQRITNVVENGHYHEPHGRRARIFAAEYGPKVIVGVFRASVVGPPQIFYAHADHAHEAAILALADSTLHEHRAFPTLLDLADAVCRTTFGAGDFTESVRQAFVHAGQPYAFFEA